MEPRPPRRSLAAALVVGSLVIGARGEGAWFALARPDASLELRSEDGQVRQRAGEVEVQRRERYYQERLKLDTHGNVYDDRLMTYSLGLGLNLAQYRADALPPGYRKAFDDEYLGNLSLLPKHVLSGTFSAERGRVTTHNVFAGQSRLDRRNLRGSLNFKRASYPMSAQFWDSRLDNPGSLQPFHQSSQGVQWLGAAKSSERLSGELKQSFERFQEAQSGGYEYRATSLRLDSKPFDRHRLHSQGRMESRDGTLLMRLATLDSGWDWGGRTVKADSRFGLEEKRVDGQRTLRQSLFAHVEHKLYDSLTSGLSGDLEFNRESVRRSRSQRAQIQEDYIKRIWGPIRFAVHADQSVRWTESRFDSMLNNVLNEPLMLADGASSFLGQLSADPRTVQVFSEDGLRRYREGFDYELVSHGSRLEVRRVITGDIANGERVLTSYQHALAGRRRTRDTAQGLRFSLQLGSRGSFWVSENRQRQDALEVSAPTLAPNSESFKDRGWGLNLRWKFFSTSQSWQERDSDIAPLKSFRSAVQAGGAVSPKTTLLAGWTYDASRFLGPNTRSLGRGYSIETRWTPLPKLELGGDARLGETKAAGLDGRYRSVGGRIAWTFRSLEAEVTDRFTWRVVAGSLSQENLVMARILRRL